MVEIHTHTTPIEAPSQIGVPLGIEFVDYEHVPQDTPNPLRIAPIIASKAIGFALECIEPPYEYKADVLDTTPESLVLHVIEDALKDDEIIDFLAIDTAEFGWRVRESIVPSRDDCLIIALKEYTSQSCGVGSKILPHELSTMLVSAAEGRISRAGLRDALTYLYGFSHKTDATQSNFLNSTITSINGRGTEVSAEHLLAAMGYKVKEATKEQDRRGADLFVNGIPFDVKSSESSAIKAADNEVIRSQHLAFDYIPAIRFVPPFTRESFEGKVVVPNDVITQLAVDPVLRRRIDEAIEDYRQRFGKRIRYDVPKANKRQHQPKYLA